MPEISVQEAARRMAAGEPLVLLDVREPEEWRLAQIRDSRVLLAPVSRLAERGTEALPDEAQDPDAAIVVYCHEGMRSLQVAAWLTQQGWTNAVSMRGGIRAYASLIDPSVGTY